MSEEHGNNGVLTEHMIIMKTRANSVADVKQLNMWGFHLRDISIFRRMPLIEVIALPINEIEILEPIQYCTNLRELLLRQNQVSDFSQVSYLQNLDHLRTLTLSGNPIAEASNYRETIISMLPQITKLDDIEITESERRNAAGGGGGGGARRQPRRTQPSFAESSPPPAPAAPPARPQMKTEPKPQIQYPRRTAMSHTTGGRSDEGALTAVLALLPELSPESLSIVLQTISELAKRQ